MGEILAAIIVAAIGLIGTHLTNKKNEELMDKSQAYNTEENEKAYKRNLPTTQIENAKSAGINPNAMLLSNGTSFGSTLAQPANPFSLLPYSNPASAIGNLVSDFASARSSNASAVTENSTRELRKQQIANQNKELEAQVKLLDLNAASQEIVNRYADARETWAIESQKASVYHSYAQASVAKKSVDRMEYELTSILPEQLKDMVAKRKLDVLNMDKVVAEISSLEQSSKESESRTALNEAKLDTEGLTQSNLSADLVSKSVNTELAEKYIEYYGELVTKTAKETELTEEQIYWTAFDKIESTSISILGNRISRSRFGERKYRKAFDKAFNHSMYKFDK